eukprot:PhM_4_TR3026/c5_g2_i10/m.46440
MARNGVTETVVHKAVRWPPGDLLRDLVPGERELASGLVGGILVGAVCGRPRVHVSPADFVAQRAHRPDSLTARPLHDPAPYALVESELAKNAPKVSGRLSWQPLTCARSQCR